MKKIIAFLSMVCVLSLAVSPALATGDVTTGFTRSTGGGQAPIVKVKWEMLPEEDWVNGIYADDKPETAGAQFMPHGEYQVNKKYEVCAVVTDPDGVSDVDAVYSDVFYPVDIYLGPDHEASRQGCGQMHDTECSMRKLSKQEGLDLFCRDIRTNNNNLPEWYTEQAGAPKLYNYDEVCAADGELQKETAYVYCCNRELSYEDPSGDYRVLVFAQDKAGVDSNYLENHFKYMDLTAFEVDFAHVNYGEVKLNTHKIVNGDLNFLMGDGLPTVRNIGNTRLQMWVEQDDMGLGKTDTSWNVRWDARVGSSANHLTYWPEQQEYLMDYLNLSETDEMDFSIEVFKFPPTHDGNMYNGQMWLGARRVSHLDCNGSY